MKLRTDYPEEYADAVKQAEEHLESPRKWRNSSSHRFSKDIISPVADGQKGMSRFLRPALGILLYPLAAPFLAIGMPLAGYEILLTVAVLMLHFFGGASVVNHLMAKKRYPERFKINRYLMEDLYGDVVDATLVRVLADKRIEVDPVTERMASPGWRDIQAVAAKVDEIYGSMSQI